MKLHLGDCLDIMRQISASSVDMILTSPPYAVGKSYDESIDLAYFLKQMFPLLKDDGVICWQVGNRVDGGFIEPLDILYHSVFAEHGFRMVNRVVWAFEHGLHCKNRFSGRYETVCVYAKRKGYTFNLDAVRVPQKYPNKKHFKGPKKGQLSCNPLGKNPGDVWHITNVKSNHPEKTSHPCQFPLELCRRLILSFSNENDVILDPFMGSGSTGVACVQTGRKFIGIEKEQNYFDIAKKRIEGSF